MVIGPSPGPAPAAHARMSSCSVSRSSWRTCPKVNERRNVPSVEGAMTRWPSTVAVCPQRSTSASSMQSPPASIEWTRVNSLRPGRAAPGRSPRSISASAVCWMPSRSASVAGSSRPALAMAWVSSKQVSSWSRVWEDCIEKVPFLVGDTAALAGAILPGQRAFLIIRTSIIRSPQRWIQAEYGTLDVDVIVDLEDWEVAWAPPVPLGRLYVSFPMDDSDEVDPKVRELAVFIASLVTSGRRVLVHCTEGLNRSGVVAARALMEMGLTASDAIDLVRRQRGPSVDGLPALGNDAFVDWLQGEGHQALP